MTKPKTVTKTKIKKALPLYGGEKLPAGTEISITDEYDIIPPHARGRWILDAAGQRRLVDEEDLEYALGAH